MADTAPSQLDSHRMATLYADIVLPLAQPAYSFSIPEWLTLCVGQAVVVQFGSQKFYTGIVWRISEERPNFKNIKPVVRAIWPDPLLSNKQQALWEWISSYYMCSLGEVMRVALPSLMKPNAQTQDEFDEREFQPRRELYVALHDDLQDAEQRNAIFEKLKRRAPKQYEALLELATASQIDKIDTGALPLRLLSGERAIFQALRTKGFVSFSEHERTVERAVQPAFLLPILSPQQAEALALLQSGFESGKSTALLHGITGSGKTEVYIHLIAQTLARGGDVLMLVPEIALTSQLVERMERIFGSRVTTYHSKLADRPRTETYLRLNRSQGGEFVVGVRSSIFLPLKQLELVIVDEEHDSSYKQQEPAPRYNARDCAVMIAQIFGGRTLLGSATPSLETWLNAQNRKYLSATLTQRYGEAQQPEIIISDTRRAAKRGERRSHFNKDLLDRIESTLARGEQVLLFQNRRGFSPYVECSDCGWSARCPDCNVSLTYHKIGERLVCHYCGHIAPAPKRCPSCRVADVVPMGFGTEKIEEQITLLFPEARVARLDRDSVTSERAFNAIISKFAAGETDILVGTQMVSKGFDFDRLTLVGILNADNMLLNPDFRAAERAYQLMTQVAGRAGRRSQVGQVVIQTSEPNHPVIRQVATADFEAMALSQLSEREMFFYPPYARLTSITLRHRDPSLLHGGAMTLAASLRKRFGRRLLGPITPAVDRIRGEYLVAMLLKIESGASSMRAREILTLELAQFSQITEYKYINVICNVDPQ